MRPPKKEHPKEKSKLHLRNRHRERYDFKSLINSYPDLRPFVKLNDYGDESIDFFDPTAVMNLNKALLRHFYNIDFWEIPGNYLCPPIPGRADYIHYVADILASENNNTLPQGNLIRCLDIGVGANCIYPIIGVVEYGWSFVGADVDIVSIESARKIVETNASLQRHVTLRLQSDLKKKFHNIIKDGEHFDLTVCNPPFHASAAEAKEGSVRKLSNLKRKKIAKPVLNFGGQSHELWWEGGEGQFVAEMIHESKQFGNAVLWFTTLISKSSNLDFALRTIKDVGGSDVKTIPMSQGNKSSRILAWTFLDSEQRRKWIDLRWKSSD